METREGWAWLPDLLLDTIIKNLILPADYIRFGAVCKHWHSIAVGIVQNNTCPMLMIPTKDSSKERRSLYNVIQSKNYDIELPIPFNRRCCGCSHGWLAFAMDDLVITLFNPFLGKQIDLPRLLNLEPEYDPQYYVRKVVLSADPFTNPDDYEVVAIYGGMERLALLRVGQKTWIRIPVQKSVRQKFVASDVIYYQGLIYAVNFHNKCMCGRIIKVDTTARTIATVARWKVNSPDEVNYVQAKSYLVESSTGELLIINRLLPYKDKISKGERIGFTSKLKIHKIGRNGEKSMLNVLGNDALFLGDNQSTSILASKFSGCRPNSIYFTDDYIDFCYPNGPRDMGILNLKDGTFECHYLPNPSHRAMPPPIWIAPTPAMFRLRHSSMSTVSR
ncbi:hypothetical protein ACH5RR_017139 [Cinchona calisaya]|uniref:KIB1-4 beta-propeller domain-containing protein n=1 Tax=Cinchona calisaya TaxID=153742 RepID=A0ABD3A162_9GENT